MADAWSYPAALREIWARSNYEKGYISNPFGNQESGERGLARVRHLLQLAGGLPGQMAIAHVAGSKGKGSTSAMLAAIGSAAGVRTGLFTSPHLHSFRERIAVDALPVSEERFADLTRRVAALSTRLEAARPELGQVTTFELLTVMALVHFRETGCGLVVLEVGLGGTYDATNVVTPAVSVITRLDLEHTAVLGSTLVEIAAAKAGIIKPAVPVVVSPQPEPVISLLTGIAADRGSPVLVAGRDWEWTGTWRKFDVSGPWGTYQALSSGLAGEHQVENAATAIAAAWILSAGGLPITARHVRQGLRDVQLAGRFERVPLASGAIVILDGAHTLASARALAATVRAEFADRTVIVVLGTSADKNVAALGHELAAISRRFVVTASENPRAAAPEHVAAGLATLPVTVEIEPTVPRAIERAAELAAAGDLILVTGSLFLVGAAREAIGLGRPDPAFDES